MTAPLFHLPDGALTALGPGAAVVLDGDEGRHAATVRRIGPGEEVLLADGSGALARCVVDAAGDGRLEATVREVAPPVVARPRLVLLQALAKGERDLQAVETATELGVDEVHPWQADRSIVRWRGEKADRGRRKWQSTVRAAAKQARRPDVPAVGEAAGRARAVELVSGAALALVLHEDAPQRLADVELPAEGDVLVVVGPEGGIEPAELAALAAAGGVAVRLGPQVLRASSAGPAALAVLCSRLRW